MERDLARGLVLRANEEPLHGDFALTLRRHQFDLGAKRDQRRSQARGADEIRRTAAENRVIAIVAIRNQALAVLHRQQAESLAVIPAARTLAEIAADRPHVANLRAGNAIAAASESDTWRRLHVGVLGQLIERDQRADAKSLWRSSGCLPAP